MPNQDERNPWKQAYPQCKEDNLIDTRRYKILPRWCEWNTKYPQFKLKLICPIPFLPGLCVSLLREFLIMLQPKCYWTWATPFECNAPSVEDLKGHWTTSASSPDFFQKSWDFYTIRSVYLCSHCMLNLTCNFNLIMKTWIFLAAAIFKSRLFKMAATVMAVEFGTIYHYSSQEENSEACSCSSLSRYKN